MKELENQLVNIKLSIAYIESHIDFLKKYNLDYSDWEDMLKQFNKAKEKLEIVNTSAECQAVRVEILGKSGKVTICCWK